MVSNIQLTWVLRIYRTYNSTVGFSKYEFYYKLLGSVILLKVIPGVIWTLPLLLYILLWARFKYST